MRNATRYTLVLAAGWLACGGMAGATTLGELGAASGTQSALSGNGGLSASKTVHQVKDSLGRSSTTRGPAGGGANAWKATDAWARAGTGSRGSSGQNWLAGGSWNGNTTRR